MSLILIMSVHMVSIFYANTLRSLSTPETLFSLMKKGLTPHHNFKRNKQFSKIVKGFKNRKKKSSANKKMTFLISELSSCDSFVSPVPTTFPSGEEGVA
jgi:hypothetical protein